jgi:ubiquinone/menaquinone biosynthesis C-methylase UbiE
MRNAGSASTLKEEIRQKYEKLARWYDLMEAITESLGVRRLRRDLLRRASGRVLEVAAGTGKNFRYYPRTCQVTAVDFSPAMQEIGRRRAADLGLDIALRIMDAESLDFPDRSFDTVVSTLSVCTYPDPVAALREMARVCRVEGRILLVEHGRSNRNWLGRWQDQRARRHAGKLGCHWSREPLDLVCQAGLKPLAARRTLLGIFHTIEATP